MSNSLEYNSHNWVIGKRQRLWFIICIIALAIGVRITVSLLTTSWVFPSKDNFWAYGHEMGQIASSIAMGKGFSWPDEFRRQGATAWMPPVYPLIISASFRIFGIYSQKAAIAIELFQIILSVATCLTIYKLGKILYNAHVGIITALIFAFYPSSIHYAVQKIWSTTLFTLSFLVIILLCLQQISRPTIGRSLGLGVLMGFAALVNPIVIGSYPFFLFWIYLHAKADRRAMVKSITTILLMLGLSITPWLIRNYMAFGQFIFIKSNFGHELFRGNNLYATGHFTKGSHFDALTKAERDYLASTDEISFNRFLLHKAINFIKTHPGRFVQLTTIRFTSYWTNMMQSLRLKKGIVQALYYVFLALSAAGVLLTDWKRSDIQLILLALISLPLPYYFTVVGLFRYRYPLEPLLLIFSGYTISWIIWSLKKRYYRQYTTTSN